jgi:hypothetical protein
LTLFFNVWKKILTPRSPTFLGKIVARNKNLLQGIIGLAGQFWQTPPELKGLVSPLTERIPVRFPE